MQQSVGKDEIQWMVLYDGTNGVTAKICEEICQI